MHKQKSNEVKMPLVSVHLITYNQKQFIGEALLSVLNQDYANIEIVVADDGSTDGTAELILDYARLYPGKIVPLVGGPNLGITRNCNKGLTACNGKYIAFFAGDDIMLPNKIKVQVDYMESHPVCSICYHNLDVFDNESGNTLYLFNDVQQPYSGGVAGLIKNGCVNGGPATMVRKEHVPIHGFDVSIPVASDWLLWIETLITNKQEIHYINQVLGKYRRHDNNITKAKMGSYTQGMRDQLATCMKVLYLYPEYAGEVRYYLGSLLRGLRFTRNYQGCLISSLQFSMQIKTVVLLILYWMTFGVVRR